jgi:uncharacterized protein YndB with AHSA1/START domain
MTSTALVIEKTLNAPVTRIWKAITEKDEMKHWYFDLEAFEPRVGFNFHFYGETEDKTRYLHLCEITEVIPGKKLTYSWRYENDPGISFVSFELIPEGDKTRVKLTHEGLETFSRDNPDFAASNFEQGWNEIIGSNLKNYVEKQ